MNTKICSQCREDKPESLFNKSNNKPSQPCKACKAIYRKRWKKKYPEKVKAERRRYRVARKKRDPSFKLRIGISNSILNAMKKRKTTKSGSIIDHLPYSMKKLKAHLESQWHPWMSWDNHGVYRKGGERKWHIDHIIPQASFNYDSMDHPDFKKCWALKNLRPVDARVNGLKGDSVKYDKLVRDKIPEILDGKGIEYHTYKINSNKEYWEKLKLKLQEEVLEFCEAKTKKTRKEEAADILEVMDAILENVGLAEVMKIKKQKLKSKGGFKKKIILLETIE